MPTYLYPLELYPDYLEGYCYLMSASVALGLYDEAYSIPIVHIEDVFLTGALIIIIIFSSSTCRVLYGLYHNNVFSF